MKILEEMIEAATAAMLNSEFGSGGPVIMTRENWKSWGAEKTWDFYKAKAMLTLEAAGVAQLLEENAGLHFLIAEQSPLIAEAQAEARKYLQRIAELEADIKTLADEAKDHLGKLGY